MQRIRDNAGGAPGTPTDMFNPIAAYSLLKESQDGSTLDSQRRVADTHANRQ